MNKSFQAIRILLFTLLISPASNGFANGDSPPPSIKESKKQTPEKVVESKIAELGKTYKNLRRLSFNFNQWQKNKLGIKPKISEGTLFFKKPNLLRWEATKGQKFTFIQGSKNSCQIEFKKVNGKEKREINLHPSFDLPHSIRALLYDFGELYTVFKKTFSKVENNKVYLGLEPTKNNPDNIDNVQLEIKLNEDHLDRIQYEDVLGNRVRLTISHFKKNPRIPASKFSCK